MAKEGSGDFEGILEEKLEYYIPQDRNLRERVLRAVSVFSEIAGNTWKDYITHKQEDKTYHGITLGMCADQNRLSKSELERLEQYLSDSVSYNKEPHNIFDKDMVPVATKHRELDGASIIDSNGNIEYAGILFPMNHQEFKRSHGIETKLAEFMGEDPEKPVGARRVSALCASEYFGNALAIVTLHEPDERGNCEISVWYDGDRIWNSAGKKMHWEYAHEQESNVLYFPNGRTEYTNTADIIAA
jgi:hypothetical protein